MIRELTVYHSGAVKLRISGSYPERFINFCLVEHIYLWGVKKQGENLLGWVSLGDFLRIRPVVWRSKNRVKVLQHYGLPFILRRWRRRKTFFVGACGFLLALYWLSGAVWFVSIEGANSIAPDKIIKIIKQQGLMVGARQDAIYSKAIEKVLLSQVPELAWVGIHFTGTRAVVEIVEKTMPFVDNLYHGDLVASKAGIVTECITLRGEQIVQIGDQIQSGDVLIRAVEEKIHTAQAHGEKNTDLESEGIVKARICYESYGEAPLQQYVYNQTGREEFMVRILVQGNEFVLKTPEITAFPAYELEQITKKLPGWRNSGLVVELIIDVYHELNVTLVENSIDQAKNAAVLNAVAKSKTLIPADAYILAQSVELLGSDNQNIVEVKLRIETEEEIGRHIADN